MITVKEIAWLAGIIEGEACIRVDYSPAIVIAMTDEDIIKRVATLFKRPFYIKEMGEYKNQWTVGIYGSDAIEWLFTVYSFLGIRRKTKALEAINKWKSQQSFFNQSFFICGHPKDSKHTYFKYDRGKARKYCGICALVNQNQKRQRN
jgi:hypothetical protein